MQQYGYLGVFLLILVENIFPPIPSEVILTFGGFMTTQSNLSPLLMIVVSTLGSVLGAVFLYKIGNIFNSERLERIINKYGRYLRLKSSDVDKAMKWYAKYEFKTVFFCRMVPIVRSLISVPAGMAKMRWAPFLLLTTAGSLIWNSALIYAGVVFGAAWENVIQYMDMYQTITIAVIGIALLVVAAVFIKKKLNKPL